MPETSLTLIVAALLFGVALFALFVGRTASRRLEAFSAKLRVADERLVNEAPALATRLGAQRAGLAQLSAATERGLWSVSRFDDRLDTVRAGLAMRRVALDRNRARLIAARATIVRVRRSAQMLIKVMELRRAILG
jgi:hypothetical protein